MKRLGEMPGLKCDLCKKETGDGRCLDCRRVICAGEGSLAEAYARADHLKRTTPPGTSFLRFEVAAGVPRIVLSFGEFVVSVATARDGSPLRVRPEAAFQQDGVRVMFPFSEPDDLSFPMYTTSVIPYPARHNQWQTNQKAEAAFAERLRREIVRCAEAAAASSIRHCERCGCHETPDAPCWCDAEEACG